MARRSDHSREELKQMIYTASRSMIASDGVESFSTRKLAKIIGYSAGIIYSYYSNMDSLVMSVNARSLEDLNELFVINIHKLNSPKEQVVKMADLFLQYANSNKNLFFALFNHRYETDVLPDWYQEKIDKVFALIESVFAKIDPSNAQARASVFWSALCGLAILNYSKRFNPSKDLDLNQIINSCLV